MFDGHLDPQNDAMLVKSKIHHFPMPIVKCFFFDYFYHLSDQRPKALAEHVSSSALMALSVARGGLVDNDATAIMPFGCTSCTRRCLIP